MAKQSVTISFSSSLADDPIELSIDMDDVKNEAANGRTSSFIFGDEAFFRVFTNPLSGVDITCFASDGVITSYEEGDAVFENQEYLEFNEPPESHGGVIEDNVASLAFPVYSDFIATGIPVGSNPSGSVTLDPADPSKAKASIAAPGVYDASYTSHYWSFSIRKDSIPIDWPVDEPYPIVIVVVGLAS